MAQLVLFQLGISKQEHDNSSFVISKINVQDLVYEWLIGL